MALIDDLKQAEASAAAGWQNPPCGVCYAIEHAPDEDKAALTSAFAGSIGVNKLVVILAKNGVTGSDGASIGRRTIYRHREEEHTS